MRYRIDDLGPQVRGETWLKWRLMRHPRTGVEYAVGSLSLMGFMLVRPQTGEARQTTWEGGPLEPAWAIDQGPDGAIYQVDFAGRVLRWDWQERHSRQIGQFPFRVLFGAAVARDGRIYAADYQANRVLRLDPATGHIDDLGSFASFGQHVRDVYAAPDGTIYVSSITYGQGRGLVAIDPASGERRLAHTTSQPHRTDVIVDGRGRVLVVEDKGGCDTWHELRAGRLVGIDPANVRVTTTHIGEGPWALHRRRTPLVFDDGSSITQIVGSTFTYVGSDGQSRTFTVEREEAPLKIWSIGVGAGKVWGGCVFPPTLFQHDPATGQVVNHGNVTPASGEIYSIAVSHGKVYAASYTHGYLTRYDPNQPWVVEPGEHANPAQLGMMKPDGLPVHRPRGRAVAPDGAVFFSAVGSYGCEDSAVCRVDPATDTVTRWTYPQRDLDAICYLPGLDQLVVSDHRKGEDALRFTFLDPRQGNILSDEVTIEDRGSVRSWLYDGADTLYGVHAHRACLFAYSLAQRRIVASLPELPYGEHCYNCLLLGPDDRIWGLTSRCVFAATRDLTRHEMIGEFPHAGQGGYRFGMACGPDGNIYFPNGPNLMRIVIPRK